MDEHQRHIDRIISGVAASQKVARSRPKYESGRNLQRLTWLATFFFPIFLIVSILFMQVDVSRLPHTIWIWATAAIPLDVIVFILLVGVLNLVLDDIETWTTWFYSGAKAKHNDLGMPTGLVRNGRQRLSK